MMANTKLSNFRLANVNGEYSANPNDYWNYPENYIFANCDLVATEHKGEWTRTKLIKHNPTKKDLIEIVGEYHYKN